MPAFRNESLLPTTPARIGVCSPIPYAADRPIGAIERRTRITVWTNDPAAGAARRIGSAAGTMTDVADLFAMSDGRRLVGNRALRQAFAGDQRKNRCHCEDSFSHERPVRSVESTGRCYRASVERQLCRRRFGGHSSTERKPVAQLQHANCGAYTERKILPGSIQALESQR